MISHKDVGPGRPPKQHQFRPGQSGNPRGRPKGSRNFQTLLEERLKARVTVQERGRERRLTVREVIVGQLVNAAAKGSVKHLQMVLALLDEAGQAQTLPPDAELPKLNKASLKRIMRSLDRLTTRPEDSE